MSNKKEEQGERKTKNQTQLDVVGVGLSYPSVIRILNHRIYRSLLSDASDNGSIERGGRQ